MFSAQSTVAAQELRYQAARMRQRLQNSPIAEKVRKRTWRRCVEVLGQARSKMPLEQCPAFNREVMP
jgi:hypothetical protein